MGALFLIVWIFAVLRLETACAAKNIIKYPKECVFGDCSYFLQWEVTSQTEISFYLTAKSSHSNPWIAVGFADRPGMPDSGAVECISTSNGFIYQASYNEKYKNHPLKNGMLGLIPGSLAAELKPGRMCCNFSHVVEVKDSDPEAWKVKPLNKALYVLMAHGPATTSGKKKKHSKHPYISESKINFLYSNSTDIWTRSPSVIIHGSLMVILWMIVLSLATTSSRYFKDDQTLCFRKPLWFQVHRFSAVFSLVLIICSILIMARFLEWTFLASTHSIMGLVVMSMVALNVTMGIFRPQVGKPTRKYFQCIHGFCGHMLHLLGFTTLCLGLRHHKAYLPTWVSWIPIGFFVFKVTIDVILTRLKRPARQYRYKEINASEDETVWNWRHIIATSYIAVGFCASIVIILALNYFDRTDNLM